MEPNELLEECVDLHLTPLQTLLLSKTVTSVYSLLKLLSQYSVIEIQKINKDNGQEVQDYSNVGNVLIQSIITELQTIRVKIWENGKGPIGENIPEEFEDVVSVFSTVIEAITNIFIDAIDRGVIQP